MHNSMYVFSPPDMRREKEAAHTRGTKKGNT